MAHDVEFTIPKRPLGRADIEFIVAVDDPASGKQKRLGMLKVSKGSLVWFRGKTTVNGRKLSWQEFDKFVEQYATKRESR